MLAKNTNRGENGVARLAAALKNGATYLAIKFFALLLAIYRRLLSPYIASDCRFSPSCSEYARQAIAEHRLRGVWLAAKRLLRCTFWQGRGFDPVAARTKSSREAGAL